MAFKPATIVHTSKPDRREIRMQITENKLMYK